MKKNVSFWGGLRGRLLASLGQRGQKAELARELGVARQAVNGWLSGEVTPNAETTLRLLEWVTAAEAKQTQKKSAGASETPARKTRTRKSKHEKPSSDRKKK